MARSETEIRAAFVADGYRVVNTAVCGDKRGFLAEHTTAFNKGTSQPKRAIWVEGDGYEMGNLTGQLAESCVNVMTREYVDHVIPDFINPDWDPVSKSALIKWVVGIIRHLSVGFYGTPENPKPAVPLEFLNEMKGLADGCRKANPASLVTYEDVLALNVGIDCLTSALYAGDFSGWMNVLLPGIPGMVAAPPKPPFEFAAAHFRLPLACNAFHAFGNATSDGKFYFGRSFQFPVHGGFENCACFIIHNPTYSLNGRPALPTVSQSAPGFVGSVTAMNASGVGVGTDMCPSGNCDVQHPGLGSLLMVRYVGACGYSAQAAVDAMIAAQRGVTAIFPIGDADNARAVMVETGKTVDGPDNWLQYPPADYLPLLPPPMFLKPSQRGLFARWNDWASDPQFQKYNPDLFPKMGFLYDASRFSERGYINPDWTRGVDRGYYFAPQRESKPDLVVATNIFLVPEMRLCAMKKWTSDIAREHMADLIWRYDELNNECLDAYGTINWNTGVPLIDFLSPKRKFYDYYNTDPVIEGSVSLCNLTDRKITSHFGYYDDDWVNISLRNYI